MPKDFDRSGWSVSDHEKYLKTLLSTQNTLTAQDEEKSQTIFDLERKLKVKEAMEKEYTAEIAEMESTIENLRSEVEAKKASMATMQRTLATSNDAIEDLKTVVPAPAPGHAVGVQTEEVPRGPDVTWVEWQEHQEKSKALQDAIEDLSLKVVTLQSANDSLQQDVSGWELKAVNLAGDRDAAVAAFTDADSLLEDCKNQLSVAHEEIALLREQPMLSGTRGNSLFGEVDDVRKEIAKKYDELKKKYLSLSTQYRRATANPHTFAADRAGLQALVSEVTATRDQLEFVQTDSLRRRIQVQEEVIQGLTAERPEPIKVVGSLGVKQMRYIEGLVDAGKQRERKLQIRLNDLSKAHLLMQEELAVSQASLAATNVKLVQELANRRIEFIDRALKEANGVSVSDGDRNETLPLDAPGSSNVVRAAFGPAATAEKSAPPEPVAGPSRERPVAQFSAVAAPAGPIHDMNYDEAWHTPPRGMPPPTIRGSARTPSFEPVGFAKHGASKRRASTEGSLPDGKVEDTGERPRRLSEPDEMSLQHVRNIHTNLNSVEGASRPQQRRSMRISVNKSRAGIPEAVGPVSNEKEVDVLGNPKPMEEDRDIKETTNRSQQLYSTVHIPALKRQKTADDRKTKPKPANK